MAFERLTAWYGAWTAGSLLRRTLLSVAAFVIGSAAFITFTSLVLVSIARGVFPPNGASGTTAQRDDTEAASKSGPKTMKPMRKARGADDATKTDDADKHE